MGELFRWSWFEEIPDYFLDGIDPNDPPDVEVVGTKHRQGLSSQAPSDGDAGHSIDHAIFADRDTVLEDGAMRALAEGFEQRMSEMLGGLRPKLRGDVEDALAEAMHSAKAWDEGKELLAPEPANLNETIRQLVAWIRRMAKRWRRREAKRLTRKWGDRIRALSSIDADEALDSRLSNLRYDSGMMGSADEARLSEAMRNKFVPALRDQPSRDFSLFVLRYVDELSFDQIAQLIGVTETNARKIHSRLLARLHEALGDGEDFGLAPVPA